MMRKILPALILVMLTLAAGNGSTGEIDRVESSKALVAAGAESQSECQSYELETNFDDWNADSQANDLILAKRRRPKPCWAIISISSDGSVGSFKVIENTWCENNRFTGPQSFLRCDEMCDYGYERISEKQPNRVHTWYHYTVRCSVTDGGATTWLCGDDNSVRCHNAKNNHNEWIHYPVDRSDCR